MDLAVSKGGKGGRGAGGRKKVSKSSKAGLQVSPKGVSLWRFLARYALLWCTHYYTEGELVLTTASIRCVRGSIATYDSKIMM